MTHETLSLAEDVRSRLYRIRGREVLLEADIAPLYGLEARAIEKLVDRILEDLPEGFLFQLTPTEAETLRLRTGRLLPCALTERGVAMLAGLLRSEKALQVSVAVLRAFSQAQETPSLTQDAFASSVAEVV